MKRVLACAAMLALGGCVSLLPEPAPAPRMFVLEAGDMAALSGAPINVVIGVDAPQGERANLSSSLVWRTGDELAFVAGAQWSARADAALQAMVVEAISAQGLVRAAVRAGEASSDYDVRWTVRDFEILETGTGMEARFAADVVVVRARTRHVAATRRVEAAAPLADRSAGLAAQALARAARQASAEIGAFTAEAVRADQSSAASTSR